MKLLIIRHAIAAEREDFSGPNDDLRPLTDEGREKMKRNVAGLRVLLPQIDTLATSPLLRAQQTAEIVAHAYAIDKTAVTDALVPEEPYAKLERWLAKHAEERVVAVVGHEPHLSGLATWLVTGANESGIALKKGGACLIDFARRAKSGEGTLEWLLTPRILGRIGS
jgi:phosphohistidine phosphatase